MAFSVGLDSLFVDNLAAFTEVVVLATIDLFVALDGVIGDKSSPFVVVEGCGNMDVEDGLKSIGVETVITFFVVGITVVVVVLIRFEDLSVDEVEDLTVLEETFNLINSVESGGIGVESWALFVIVVMPAIEYFISVVAFGEFSSVVVVEGILVAVVVGVIIVPYDVWSCFCIVVAREAFQDIQII